MARRKQFTASMQALRLYQPKGQAMRYEFGAESLAKLDDFVKLQLAAQNYDSKDIHVLQLDVFVYKHFKGYGWFFGIISRYWDFNGMGCVQIVYIDKDFEDVPRNGYAGYIVDASAADLSEMRDACKRNVHERARDVERASRLDATRAMADAAMAVAMLAPRREWNMSNTPPPSPPPPSQQRRFTKTIASPGRLSTESSDVVFQGVRSPHIFVVQSDDSDDSDGEEEQNESFNTFVQIPATKTSKVEMQCKGSPHIHFIE